MGNKNPYIFPGLVLSVGEIENAAAATWNIPVNSLYQKTKAREVVEARYSVFYYRKTKMNQPEPDIARTVPFDRTTIIHAIKLTENLLAFNRAFQEKYRSFETSLSENLVNGHKVGR